ncbi:MAG TPA: hypothetical protein VGM93_09100 [Acidimicrobiales bacterium]|jgi:hypothetical protein
MTITDEPAAEPAPDFPALFAQLTAQLADVRRLALGRSVGVEPAAIPSTGLIPDVTDGALIESAWGVAIGGSTGRVLQRFDNWAQLKAQWPSPPDGVQGVTLDDGRIYVRRAARWYTDVMVNLGSMTTDASGLIAITTATPLVSLDVITGGIVESGFNADSTVYAFSSSRLNAGTIQVRVFKLTATTSGTVAIAASTAIPTITARLQGYRN